MRTLFFLLILALGACDSATDIDERWSDPATIEYAASLNVDLSKMNVSLIKLGSGTYPLYWMDKTIGEGDSAKVGESVRVHYTAWLPDGTEFETTRGKEPIVFLLGVGLVMPGFDAGVIGMRIGGVRRLVIPPELAFGRRGKPQDGIPPASTVIVEVERLTTPAH
jgi:FKBP-type peptidyl-prolyl cis-trans isomerase FkpA